MRTVLALLASAVGFQPGNYAQAPAPPPSGPAAQISFTAGQTRVTDLVVGVINAPCHGPITRRHKSGPIGGGGPFHAPIDSSGRFKVRIQSPNGGETGTLRGQLHGSTASGTVTLQVHFYGIDITNPNGPNSCGVKRLHWTASTQFGLPS